jgi:hypothetical protein
VIVDRNPTYQQLRARTRLGAFTVAQYVQLTFSTLAALGAGMVLVRLGAPAGPALTLGVLIAGAPVMASLVFEGHEFDALSLVLAAVRWTALPRRFDAGGGRASTGYLVTTASRPRFAPRSAELP